MQLVNSNIIYSQKYKDLVDKYTLLKKDERELCAKGVNENASLFQQLSYYGTRDALTRQLKFVEDAQRDALDEIDHVIGRLHADLVAHHARVVELEKQMDDLKKWWILACFF